MKLAFFTRSATLHCPCRYAKGDEVFLCYGRHTNLELLEHYGFVLQDNPHDTVILTPDKFPPAVQQQLLSLGTACTLHADGNPSWELLRALRLAGMTADERRESAFLVLQDRPVSSRVERWVAETLQQACQSTLSALPTSLEHDEGVLQCGGLSDGMAVAVQWRVRHKAILHATIRGCQDIFSSCML